MSPTGGEGKDPQPLVLPSFKPNVKGSDVWLPGPITDLNFSWMRCISFFSHAMCAARAYAG